MTSSNGWSTEKHERRGQECEVIAIYGDRTVTARFDDGKEFDFPFESIHAQLTVGDGQKIVKGITVQLVEDEETFKASFTRFENDHLKGWSTEKHERRGQECEVIETYGDRTVTARFDDGKEFDFPFESIHAQLFAQQLGDSSLIVDFWASVRPNWLCNLLFLDFSDFDNVILMGEFIFSTLFMSLLAAVIRALDCVYPDDGSPPFLRSSEDMMCWRSTHQLYANISLLFLVGYLGVGTVAASAGAVAMMNEKQVFPARDPVKRQWIRERFDQIVKEDQTIKDLEEQIEQANSDEQKTKLGNKLDRIKKELNAQLERETGVMGIIRPFGINIVADKLTKIVVVVVSTHVAPAYPWISLWTLLGLSLFMTAWSLKFPPTNYPVFDKMRIGVHVSCAVNTGCSIIAKTINDESNWLPIALLVAGNTLLVLVQYNLYARSGAAKARTKYRAETPELTDKAKTNFMDYLSSNGYKRYVIFL